MNNATLEAFRSIADTMMPDQGWQWIGPHMSQRMFGISEARAKDYARRFGGYFRRNESIRTAAESLELLGEICKLVDSTKLSADDFTELCDGALFYANTMSFADAAKYAVEEVLTTQQQIEFAA